MKLGRACSPVSYICTKSRGINAERKLPSIFHLFLFWKIKEWRGEIETEKRGNYRKCTQREFTSARAGARGTAQMHTPRAYNRPCPRVLRNIIWEMESFLRFQAARVRATRFAEDLLSYLAIWCERGKNLSLSLSLSTLKLNLNFGYTFNIS